jgi:hypothetical protein
MIEFLGAPQIRRVDEGTGFDGSTLENLVAGVAARPVEPHPSVVVTAEPIEEPKAT